MRYLFHPYEYIIGKFKYWIIFCLVGNVVTFLLLLISSFEAISTNKICVANGWYQIHWWIEYVYFVASLFLVIQATKI